VSEETFAHSHPSWSSDILCQLPSSTIRSIASSLTVQFTCLTVLFHNLSPGPLWSSSWSGPQLLLLLFLFFLKRLSAFGVWCPQLFFFLQLEMNTFIRHVGRTTQGCGWTGERYLRRSVVVYFSGGWSTDGCELISVDSSVVSCSCSHLTNFAILISPSPAVSHVLRYFNGTHTPV